ncbi:MAG: CPP1-like family protein [Gloeomargaritaceae cyanobacterium C42_A2020_066]|nr:CPP1-like family protein [Gloeomargaritaceae cyanobacterium C42_A2020_066]
MSDPNPYLQLGISEEASFEEIQSARQRLLVEHSGDERTQQAVEAAYDAILMERLRLRQQGKIKIPEKIRYAERSVDVLDPPATPSRATPPWLIRLIDTPSPRDVLIPGLIYSGLSLWAVNAGTGGAALPVALGLGVGLYCLNRKENRFGRAVLLTLAGLILGGLLGTLLGASISPLVLAKDSLTSLAIFLCLWLITSFLR